MSVEIRLLTADRWPLLHREAVLQAARVVHKPLLHVRIPLVGEALAVGLHRGYPLDDALPAGKAVAQQLQAPRPAAIPGRGEETAAVKLCGPLLARIASLPTGGGGLERVPPRLICGADARPVGLGQALGHLVGRGELLDLHRRRCRAGLASSGEQGED